MAIEWTDKPGGIGWYWYWDTSRHGSFAKIIVHVKQHGTSLQIDNPGDAIPLNMEGETIRWAGPILEPE